MKRNHGVICIGPMVLALAGCAGERFPPPALVDARANFLHARDGIAMRLDPTDVHEAEIALQRAERAWQESPNDPVAIDLAIIADRKALVAQTEAETIKARQDAQQAAAALDASRGAQLQATQGQLNQTQRALGVTQMQLQQQEAAAAAREQRVQDMEAKLKDARDTIAKIATVKDDDRGMVITLPGEVLFKTAKWDLKPGAMAKLDQIAGALRGKEHPIVVCGYTDNVGTRDTNMSLSQMRAQTVRDYLVSRGLPQDLVTAQGKGSEDPVSDNGSAEGRAQNRRVEIVVQPNN